MSTITVETICPFCGAVNHVTVPGLGFLRWQSGMLVQCALPELSASERELLITGICDPCWDRFTS